MCIRDRRWQPCRFLSRDKRPRVGVVACPRRFRPAGQAHSEQVRCVDSPAQETACGCACVTEPCSGRWSLAPEL
eukprot:13426508-Alexandrium_andersonii.AAC.1